MLNLFFAYLYTKGLSSFCLAAAVAAATLLILYWTVRKRGMKGGDGADEERVEDANLPTASERRTTA